MSDDEILGGDADPTRFDLPAQSDVRVAGDVHARCRSALEASGDVRIDCGAVERVDAAVLQCLWALADGLRQGERSLEIVDRTASFDGAVAALGFEELLGAR
jgi:anti-anti-sigma regulatory factor